MVGCDYSIQTTGVIWRGWRAAMSRRRAFHDVHLVAAWQGSQC